MDNRPIGVFDSGIGGLTSIPYLMQKLPEEQIIFFGDTARAPYGSKSTDTICHFSLQIARFLTEHHVKLIVIACNTVSAVCIDLLRRTYPDVPVIGVISPTSKVVSMQCGERNRVGVIATRLTVKSGAYEKNIKKRNPRLPVYSIACPAFVPLIEEGIIDSYIMDLMIRHYLDDFLKAHDITDLVLGCTHYPLIAHRIQSIYPNLRIISSSREVSNAVEIELKKRDMLCGKKQGEHLFFASDISKDFIDMVRRISYGKREIANIKFHNLDI